MSDDKSANTDMDKFVGERQLSKRNKANKRKGAQYETDLVNWFRDKGYLCERLRLVGAKDEGDLAFQAKAHMIVVEAKNAGKQDLSGFLSEAQREALNYAESRMMPIDKAIPIVAMKRRQHSIEQSYVVMDLDTLLRIIKL